MILQRTAEFFHAASALSCRSGLDNDMRLKCRDGSEGGRHHHRLTSYDQPVRLDIIGITCRHPRPTGSSPCVDSSESCSTAQAARTSQPEGTGVVHAWVGQNVTYSRHGHSKATRAPRTLTGAGICLKRLYIVFRDTSAVGIRT